MKILLALLALISPLTASIYVSEVADEGKKLILDNGSAWEVQTYDSYINMWGRKSDVSNWNSGDKVRFIYTIKHHNWDYSPEIYNLDKGEQTYAKPINPPSPENPSCTVVV
jgi:hypothetical protein